MTFKSAYEKASTWQRRITIISLYHNARKAKDKNWKLTDSANYFGLSIGLISESINLSEHWDVVKDCGSRNEALKRIRK